jgi:hypothetical protein
MPGAPTTAMVAALRAERLLTSGAGDNVMRLACRR